MKNQTDTSAANLDASREKLSRDIAAVAGEAAELLKNVSGRNLRRAQDALSEAQAALRSGGGDIADSAGKYVHAHPLRALGAAAAAGLVIGVLLARR